MRVADSAILTVPGWTGAAAGHWLTRWERKLSTARRVEQTDWDTPRLADWVSNIVGAVTEADKPCVLIAHGCGVSAVVHAATQCPPGKVRGAFLVAPPDLTSQTTWPATDGGFAPVPETKLPFPAKLVASTDDPTCAYDRAEAFANAWGADLVFAADAGHVNVESGHGPWPDGSLAFAGFLRSL